MNSIIWYAKRFVGANENTIGGILEKAGLSLRRETSLQPPGSAMKS